jgi:hypothetical protein
MAGREKKRTAPSTAMPSPPPPWRMRRPLQLQLHAFCWLLGPLFGLAVARSSPLHGLRPPERLEAMNQRRPTPSPGQRLGFNPGQDAQKAASTPQNLAREPRYSGASPLPPPAAMAAGGAQDRSGHSRSIRGYCSELSGEGGVCVFSVWGPQAGRAFVSTIDARTGTEPGIEHRGRAVNLKNCYSM